MIEKRYHIYLKERCINPNLSEDDFNKVWTDYKHLSEIHENLNLEDLSYEEVVFNREEWCF